MPIYEYRCGSCGHQQEFLQKVSDAQLTVCTACGKATFAKLLTAAGFHLKGSGWYATDFRNKGAAPPAKSEAKAEGGDKPVAEKTAGEGKAERGDKPAAEKTAGEGKAEGSNSGPACGGGSCAACS